ncbi:shikimate dehydrogenase [Phreatobacter aquaticus]|uniref:Shikimate dehydrogenase (NADP(+)) n=1 Tax=Phreatobacter aquaticus TaxID=2570229 RepID=A0A4D7QDJ3_9HYPH|nr:shikimate dehydrogenase [Phreatobacter aquaticus]QCK85288.1 shikimate dehydrogenase [Phreatobacter aquaticus]
MTKACVIGWPVEHARSPIIHNHWIKTYGITGSYGRELIEPGKVGSFLKNLRDLGYAGCNITVPHKEEALAALDDIDPTAAALGAVNTVWLDQDRLCGMNTDVPGFLANLDETVPEWTRRTTHAVVLGAGGAARGIVYGLVNSGVETVTVVNRSLDRAEAVAAIYPGRARALAMADVGGLLPRADLLINTTSLGMKGQPALDLPLDRLKPDAIVADIVYVPLKTSLLVEAEARGHAIVGGLGMLLHQAVPGFEHWFGVKPEVTRDLYDLVAADIEGR